MGIHMVTGPRSMQNSWPLVSISNRTRGTNSWNIGFCHCKAAYNWEKLQRKIMTYLITWDVGNVVLLHPHISDIFLCNVYLHGLIQFPKYNQLHTWYLLSILLMCGVLRILSIWQLKNKVYATNPPHIRRTKANIRREIDCISEIELTPCCLN